jgi:hypothetical protein
MMRTGDDSSSDVHGIDQLTDRKSRILQFVLALGEEFEVPFDIATERGSRTIHVGILPVCRGRYPHVDLTIEEKIPNSNSELLAQRCLN